MQLLQVCTCLTHTSPHIYPTHSTPPIALPPPLPCCPIPAATDSTKSARPTPKSRKNSVRAQMKELDAAHSGVLQISSGLETDGSPLKDTLTDTLMASQQSQVRGQLFLCNKPCPLQPSQSLPCPTHNNMEVVVDVRKVVGSRPSGSPLVCCGRILCF